MIKDFVYRTEYYPVTYLRRECSKCLVSPLTLITAEFPLVMILQIKKYTGNSIKKVHNFMQFYFAIIVYFHITFYTRVNFDKLGGAFMLASLVSSLIAFIFDRRIIHL